MCFSIFFERLYELRYLTIIPYWPIGHYSGGGHISVQKYDKTNNCGTVMELTCRKQAVVVMAALKDASLVHLVMREGISCTYREKKIFLG